MSVEYCHECQEYVDTDLNAEHFEHPRCAKTKLKELLNLEN